MSLEPTPSLQHTHWFLQFPDIVHYPSIPDNAAPAEAELQLSFRSTPEFIQGIHTVAHFMVYLESDIKKGALGTRLGQGRGCDWVKSESFPRGFTHRVGMYDIGRYDAKQCMNNCTVLSSILQK